MEQEIDQQIGVASAVMWALHWSDVVKQELSQNMIYLSIYVPSLIYGNEFR